jgi:hypothetical protein
MHSRAGGHFNLPVQEHTFGLHYIVEGRAEMAVAERFIQRLEMLKTMPSIFAVRWIAIRTENT